MIFPTYIFLLVFLPIVLVLYFGMARFVSRKVQHIFLVLASLVFYGYDHLSYVWLIVVSISMNYTLALNIEKNTKDTYKKIFFVIGILFNIALLGYFKYYNFFFENVNEFFNTEFVLKKIILPLGISFYTFQQIAYLIAVKNKEEKVPNLLDYSLFIVFFPQLVAGPIVFMKDVLHQYQDEKNRFFNIDNFSAGLFLLAIGLFKKAVIADTIVEFVDNTYYMPDRLSFGGAWLGTFAYTFYIFFDFSGYCDIAMGLAKMMNINLPVNFYSPYKSKSITEFWKRWHITLGRSLAVLIYYPLGGNRKGTARTCLNLFIIFFVSGIWHGASWTYVLWGITHGLVRVFEKLFMPQLEKIPSFIRVFGTFMFVNISFVLFRAMDMNDAIAMYKKMFIPGEISFDKLYILAFNTEISYPPVLATIYVIVCVLILAAVVFLSRKNSIDLYNEFKPNKKNAIITAALLSISIIHLSRVSAFIYFNF